MGIRPSLLKYTASASRFRQFRKRTRSIFHQLASAYLPGVQLETTWESETGEIHALVSLHIAKVQHSRRAAETLPPSLREDWAQRAALAFENFSAEQSEAASKAMPPGESE